VRVQSIIGPIGAVLTLGLCVAACGGDAGSGGSGAAAAKTLTIYSSLPLQGESRQTSQDVIAGEKLALQEAGAKAGKFAIKYVSLDDATAATGKWEPSVVSNNARKAGRDESAIAYLGEYNSGASAISIPILNEAGLLQVFPSNTYVGLTRSEGAEAGEPDKYYPTGERTFGRVVRTDHAQALAQVNYQKAKGCTALYTLHDKEVYGKGLADQVAETAATEGIEVLGNEGIDIKAANFRSLAQKAVSAGADCVFFGGVTANKGVQLWKDLHAADPKLKLFGPDGLAEPAFTTKIGDAEAATFLTAPVLPPDQYPPAGQKFFRTFEQKYGHQPAPYAIYGYEAMMVALLAIEKAGENGDDRHAVVDAFFAIKDRDSVLGKYSIDPNGDTTASQEGGYRVKQGKQVFDTLLTAKDAT
jgi:branched-chain amino acid transport system substrate-binding protein